MKYQHTSFIYMTNIYHVLYYPHDALKQVTQFFS